MGLGAVGQDFAEYFLEIIQEGGKPVEIVAVASRHIDSLIALGFEQSGVAVFADAVDIIFDLTGKPETRQALGKALQKSNHHHTVIAPEVMAKLLWIFFGEDEYLRDCKGSAY